MKSINLLVICVAVAYSGSLFAQTEQAKNAFQRDGEASLTQGRIRSAQQLFEAGLSEYPRDPGLLEDISLMFAFDGDFPSAIKYAHRLLALSPDDYNGHLVLSASELQCGCGALSNAVLTWLLKNGGNDPLAQAIICSAQATCLTSLASNIDPHDTSLAVRLFQKPPLLQFARRWLESESQSRSQVLLAKTYLANGSPERAIDILTAVLKSDPQNVDALVMLSAAQWANHDTERARRTLIRAHEDLTGRPAELLSFGKIATQEGGLDTAIEVLQQALRQQPSDAELHDALGEALYKANRPKEALPELLAAVAASPRDAHLKVDLAIVHAELGSNDIAITTLRKAVNENPTFGAAHYYLGRFLWKQGEESDALREVQIAAEQLPDKPFTHAELGSMYFEGHQYDNAEPELRRAIALDPRVSRPHYLLGLLLARTKRLDESKREVELSQAARKHELDESTVFQIRQLQQ